MRPHETNKRFKVFANPYGKGEPGSMDHRGRGHAVVPYYERPVATAGGVGAVLCHETTKAERRLREGVSARDAVLNPDLMHARAVYRFHSQTGEVVGGAASENPKAVDLVVPKIAARHHYAEYFASGHLVAGDEECAREFGTMGMNAAGAPVFEDPIQVLKAARAKGHAAWEREHSGGDGFKCEGALGPKTAAPAAPATTNHPEA